MLIRPYLQADMNRCLAIFDSNTPPFFAPGERPLLERFLRQPNSVFLVVEAEGGSVVACGGYEIMPAEATGYLHWCMVVRDYHRRGIGRRILLARLNQLCDQPGIDTVAADTSQYARGFLEHYGFTVQRIQEGGYGPGLHRYDLSLPLDETRRAAIRAAYAGLPGPID